VKIYLVETSEEKMYKHKKNAILQKRMSKFIVFFFNLIQIENTSKRYITNQDKNLK